jgi:hypothetical protein
MIILILLSVIAIVITLMSFISLAVYGGIVDDDVVLEWVDHVKTKGKFRTNFYDGSIISSDTNNYLKDKFFSKPPMPIFFKYYINDVGVIWRWSKGAQALDQVRNELAVGSSKESQRKKLGL